MPWSYIKFSQLILKGNVWRPVWRICTLILRLKGLMLKESNCRFVICFVIANPRNLRSATNGGRSCEGPLTRAYKKASIQLLNSESVHSRLLEMFAYRNEKMQSGAIGRAVCLTECLLRELSLLSWIFPKKCIQKLTIASSILCYS